MVGTKRYCEATNASGEPCNASPLRDEPLCFWHSPEHAAEARRLGGLRRRREGTLAGAYDLEGLDSVPRLRRVLEIAAFDALGLENSIARTRALTAVVQTAARLLEVGELEERLELLEATINARGPARGGGR